MTSSDSALSRSEQHLQMAEEGLRAFHAITEAHVAGKIPEVRPEKENKKPVEIWFLGGTALQLEEGMTGLGTEDTLKEMQVYWPRIPNFGMKEWRVYPNETGWAQVTVWAGTGVDGERKAANEVDVITTDKDFNIVRWEIYWDRPEWQAVWDYVSEDYLSQGKEPIKFPENYMEHIARQPGLAAYKNKEQ
jgi:hypothetical protein